MPDIEGPYTVTAPLDLEAINADLAAALHPEWFVGLDHQCGDDWLAVFDADPDSLGSSAAADAALVCGGIHPDRVGRAAFIAAAPLRVAALLAEVERLTSERDVERAMRIERDGLLAAERQRFTAAYDAAQKLAGERDEARAACHLAQEAFRTAIPFGTNPDDRNRSRATLDHASAAVSAVLGVG